MAIAALTVDLNARIANFESELKRATGTLDRFGKTSSAISTGFKAAFAGVGVAGLAAFAKSSINAADAFNDLSDRVGVSVKDLASFKLAAQLADTSLEGVGKGIARLTRSIGEAEGGNKKLAETLNTLGITARDPKEAFFQLADAVQKTEDPSKRAALLSQVLGKSYQELIPLLSQGSEGLRESAKQSESFSEAMVRLAPNAAKFNDDLDKLKTNAAGFAATILGPVVEAINEMSAGFERLGRLRDAGAGFLDIFSGRANADIKASLENINSEINKLEDSKKKFGFLIDKKEVDTEINRLKGLRSELHNLAIEMTQAPHKSQSKNPLGGINLPANTNTKGSGAKLIDPLASLLSQTDTAKFAEYTKLQDLLNARFERGTVTGKQYAEALTVLRKGYYTDELKAYAEQLEYNLETERLVADHLKSTTDALNEQKNAWADAGRALEDEMRTPLENANIEFGRLQELLDRGAISWDTYARAVFKASEDLDEIPKKADDMQEAYKDAFATMTNGLAKFIATGKGNFKELTRTMLEGLAEVAAKSAILSGLKTAKAATGGSGFWFSILDAIVPNAKGNVFNSPGLSAYSGQIVSKPTVFPFAKGIGLMGEAGPEAVMPLRRGKDGKLGVASSGGGGGDVNVSIAIDASGTKVQGDEGKAGQLARDLENVVLGVIVKHQRPGGMLA